MAGGEGVTLPDPARGNCLLEALHSVLGFHLEEEGGAASARLDTEAEEEMGGSCIEPWDSATASWPADLLWG